MSDTPRTDDVLMRWEEGDLVELARNLELENKELQHQLGIVKAILVKVEDERNELLRMIAEDEPLK